MRAIGHILHHQRGGEQAEFSAAFVVGAANDIILRHTNIGDHDARAMSFRNGTLLVDVSHGAVAGMIQQQAARLIQETNKKLAALGGAPPRIIKILTRLQPPRSP